MVLKLKKSVMSGMVACPERCAELPEERKRKRGHLWRDQHHAGEAPSCLRENRQGKPSQVHVSRQGQGVLGAQKKASEQSQYKYPKLLNKEKSLPVPFLFSNESNKKFTFTHCFRSMTFWGGSGSGSADPCLWLMDPDPAIVVIDHQDANKKTNFLTQFFLLITFWRYIYIIFQR